MPPIEDSNEYPYNCALDSPLNLCPLGHAPAVNPVRSHQRPKKETNFMGKGDNRVSRKMRRKNRQAKKKARAARKKIANKVPPKGKTKSKSA